MLLYDARFGPVSFLFLFVLGLTFSSPSMGGKTVSIERSAELSATATWFNEKCDGVELTFLIADHISRRSENIREFDKRYHAVQKAMNGRWDRTAKQQRAGFCLRSLILFGPNGKAARGLLTATPALQEKLPIDIRKDLGF